MARLVIIYTLVGAALTMLGGGVFLLGDAIKRFITEGRGESDAAPTQQQEKAKPRIPQIQSTSSMKSAAR